MSTPSQQNELRLWPAILALIVQWIAAFGIGMVTPSTMIHGLGLMFGPPLGLLLILIWWGFFSGAAKRDRILGAIVLVAAIVVVFALGHRSMIPTPAWVYGIPTLCLTFVLGAWLTRAWPDQTRLRALAALVLAVGGAWTLVRTEGVDGDMSSDFEWRWKPTPEQRLLAQEPELLAAPPSVEQAQAAEASTPEAPEAEPAPADDSPQAQPTEAEGTAGEAAAGEEIAEDAGSETQIVPPPTEPEPLWPAFRGPERDGVIPGLRIATDWQANPPAELWRRAVGPGWSSFVVADGLLYTQEQRGEDEIVSAYRTDTGQPVWMHKDKVRFWEALAGAGPRSTPALHDGKIYSLGATGLLNTLDADDGSLIWSRNAAEDTSAPTPEWGFSSSPLVVDGLVILHTGGPDDKGVVAYDAVDGEPRWFASASRNSYSSAHLANLGGMEQWLLITDSGVAGYGIGDGQMLWQHEWPLPNGARVVQPAFVGETGVLIGTGFGYGLRRIDVQYDGGAWQVDEGWTATGLKPYYNDFVVHKGHAYGFDGRILAAVELETGERAWKGGRYGSGQLVLLPDQDLLVVLSERGEVALVSADPSGFSELAKIPAIQGKTWNHPVIADGVLYVRNGEEMAAFRLNVESRVASAR